MTLLRACSIVLLIAPVECRIVLAQHGDQDLSVSERAYIASRIYSSIECYFAHRAGIADLDTDSAFRSYLDKALTAKGRLEFDLATQEFIARLRNKHTQFDDRWLYRNHGQPLGFWVAPVEGKWVITRAHDDRLRRGDVIRAIDGVAIETFVRDKRRYIAASSERIARSLLFDRAYLFPRRFALELEDGRKIAIERVAPSDAPAQEARAPASEGRWVTEGSVAYIKIPGFNHANFEKTAIEFVGRYRGSQCLIIDVRSNGGGSTPHELLRELMNREWRDWATSTPSLVALHRAQGRLPHN